MTTPDRRSDDRPDGPDITIVPSPIERSTEALPPSRFRKHQRYRIVYRDRGVERIDTGRYRGDGLARWENDDEWRVFAHIFQRADGNVWTARPGDVTGALPLDDEEPTDPH